MQADAKIRFTVPTKMVLHVFSSADAGTELSGAQIRSIAGLGTGTLYPILFRLERAGWLESRWEDIDPKQEKRPRRRFYKATEALLRAARSLD